MVFNAYNRYHNRHALRVVRLIEVFSKLAGALATVLLVAIVSLMLIEIIWRFVLGKSLHFTWEYSSYAMSGVFLLGASYALRCGSHVRVTSVLELVPPKISFMMDLLCTIIGLIVTGLMTLALFTLALTSYQGNVVSFTINRVPLSYPQFMMTIGAGLMTLQFFARLLRLIIGEVPDVLPGDDKLPGSE